MFFLQVHNFMDFSKFHFANCNNLLKEAVEGNAKLKIVGVKAYPYWMDN